MKRHAVVLLSGRLDSATMLAMANADGFETYALSMRYGQHHSSELKAAKKVAVAFGAVRHEIVGLDLRKFGGSALTDDALDVPTDSAQTGIPITYVPVRSTIVLSLTLGWAEAVGAHDLFSGANAVDYSGYPDCRPEYVAAYETLANLATKTGMEGERIRVNVPIIDMTKTEIIQAGVRLGIDYGLTVSCYKADDTGRACDVCDSCRIRKAGFEATGVSDPTRYV